MCVHVCLPVSVLLGSLPPHSLGQVPGEDLPGILAQVLLEDGGEGDHGLSSAEQGALHHALLIIDKEISTAGQHGPRVVCAGLGGTLCSEISHEAVNQLPQVPRRVGKVLEGLTSHSV